MNFSIPDHPSTIDGELSIQIMDNTLYHPFTQYPGSPRNQRGAGPSNRSRDISYRDVYNEGQSEGVYYGPAAQTRGWRTAIATPTRVGFISSYLCNLAHKKPHRGRPLFAYVYPGVMSSDVDNFSESRSQSSRTRYREISRRLRCTRYQSRRQKCPRNYKRRAAVSHFERSHLYQLKPHIRRRVAHIPGLFTLVCIIHSTPLISSPSNFEHSKWI